MDVVVDKAYVAPNYKLDKKIYKDENLPAAILPEGTANSLPRFSSPGYTFGNDQARAADAYTFLIEEWLAMEWEGVNEITSPRKKEISSDDFVADDVSTAGSVSSRASISTQTAKGNIFQTSNKSLETKKEDPTKSLRQRSIRFLLPLLKFSIKRLRIVVF